MNTAGSLGHTTSKIPSFILELAVPRHQGRLLGCPVRIVSISSPIRRRRQGAGGIPQQFG